MTPFILLISSEFPPLPGGIGNHAYHLARMLQKAGKKVSVLTDHRNRNTEVDELAFDQGLPFQVIRLRRYLWPVFTYLRRFNRAINLLRKEPDGVLITSGRFPLWLGAVLSLFFPRYRFIAVLHGSELSGQQPLEILTRWGLGRYHLCIAVSNFTLQLAQKLRPTLNVKVIPNGFAPLFHDQNRLSDRLSGRPILITVGNVSYRKGQHNVINALPSIRKIFPEVQYHIVGIPTEQKAFTALATSLGVTDCVTFHGAVSAEQLPILLSCADVFLMLSERLPNGDVEGFGIAILESNNLGLPAIGSNDSGIADAIHDGFSGRLVPPGDVEEVTNALEDIMSNYILYSKQTEQWSECFRWEKIINQYLGVLKELTTETSKTSSKQR